jgi:hypothetical protein
MFRRGIGLLILGFALALFSGVETRLIADEPPKVGLTMLRERYTDTVTAIKLRWSFSNITRFPEGNFELQRSDDEGKDGTWKSLGPLNLPDSLEQLVQRLQDAYNFRGRLFPNQYGHPIFQVAEKGLDALRNDTEVKKLWDLIQRARGQMITNPSQCSSSSGPGLPEPPGGRVPPGTPEQLPADPTGLLLMASIDPLTAYVLGLSFYDELINDKVDFTKLRYKVSGTWNKCNFSGRAAPPFITKVTSESPSDQPIPDKNSPLLFIPEWPDQTTGERSALAVPALVPLTRLPLSEPNQMVTDFYEGKPFERTPSPVDVVRPIVKATWRCSPLREIGVTGGTVGGQQPGDHRVFPAGFNVYRAEGATEPSDDKYKLVNFFSSPVEISGPFPRTIFIQVPALILPDTCDPSQSEEDRQIEFIDRDASLKPNTVYWYRIEGVDLFGRKSQWSVARKIGPLPAPNLAPIPPQNFCLRTGVPPTRPGPQPPGIEVPDSTCGVLGKWISDVDMKQQPNHTTTGLPIQLRWQWGEREEEKRINNLKSFKVYILQDPKEAPCQDLASAKGVATYGVDKRAVDFNITLPASAAVSYYYYCITTVVSGTDSDGDGLIDEDPSDGIDNDLDGKTDEDGPDSGETESEPSIPVVGYIVDMLEPADNCKTKPTWKPQVPPVEEIDPRPDWEGKVGVRLTWGVPPSDGTVKQYNIYRAFEEQFVGDNTPKPDLDNNQDKIEDVYIKLNTEPIVGTVYTDRIEASARNRFYYKLKAIDDAGNESDFSCASDAIQLPPPLSTPVIISVDGGNESARIIWTANPNAEMLGPSTDPLAGRPSGQLPPGQNSGYRIYRVKDPVKDRADAIEKAKDPDNLTLIRQVPALPPRPPRGGSPGEPEPISLTANQLTVIAANVPSEAGVPIYYVIEAYREYKGETILNAFSEPVMGQAFDATPPKPPFDLKPALEKVGGKYRAKLSWTLPSDGVQTAVWRRREDQPKPGYMITGLIETKIGSAGLPSGQFTDDNEGKGLLPGQTYYYAFQDYDKFGNRSDFSEEIKVEVPSPCKLDLGALTARELTGFEVEVSARYSFNVDSGTPFARSPALSAGALSQGREQPFFTAAPATITPGAGTALIRLNYGGRNAPPTLKTDAIRVVLTFADECGKRFVIEFKYDKSWTPDDIYNLRPKEISGLESELTVDYGYFSEHGDNVQIRPVLLQGGREQPFFRVTTPAINRAKGTTTMRVTYDGPNRPPILQTDAVRFELFVPGRETFFTKTFPLNRTWRLPVLKVEPAELKFSGQLGTPGPQSQLLTINEATGLRGFAWSASSDVPWVKLNPTNGATPGTVTVSVDPIRPVGTHRGTIKITAPGTANSPVSVPVTFEQRDRDPVLQIDTIRLTFSGVRGEPNPPPQPVRITNTGGGTLRWRAAVDSPWLSIQPNTGIAPTTAQVFVDVSRGSDGARGAITITADGAQGSPQTIVVTLRVMVRLTLEAFCEGCANRPVSIPVAMTINGTPVTTPARPEIPQNSSVTLNAPSSTTVSGRTLNFQRWEQDGRTVSSSTNYSFTATGSTNLRAVYAPPLPTPTVTLSINATCEGCATGPIGINGVPVSVNGVSGSTPFSRTVNQNSAVTVSAPSSYTVSGQTVNFQRWEQDGRVVSSSSSYNFTATANTTLRAVYTRGGSPPGGSCCTLQFKAFLENNGRIEVNVPITVNGVSRTTPFSVTLALNAAITMQAQATVRTGDVTWNFDHWESDGRFLSSNNPLSGRADKDEAIVVVYKPRGVTPMYVLTVRAVNISNSGASISTSVPVRVTTPSETSDQNTQFSMNIPSGTSVTLRILQPDTGTQCGPPGTAGTPTWKFDRWTGAVSSTDQQVTLTIYANTTITAEYRCK